MSEATVVWDMSARSRLSGLGATNVIPVALTRSTRRVYEYVASNVARLAAGAEATIPTQPGVLGVANGVRPLVLPIAVTSTRETVGVPASQRYVLGRLQEMAEAPDLESGVLRDFPVLARAWTEGQLILGADTPTPSVVPSDEGGVTFVWHKGGWDVEVQVDPVETTVWAQSRRTGTTWYGSLDDHRSELRALLREMSIR
jgi:hypothetical protein